MAGIARGIVAETAAAGIEVGILQGKKAAAYIVGYSFQGIAGVQHTAEEGLHSSQAEESLHSSQAEEGLHSSQAEEGLHSSQVAYLLFCYACCLTIFYKT